MSWELLGKISLILGIIYSVINIWKARTKQEPLRCKIFSEKFRLTPKLHKFLQSKYEYTINSAFYEYSKNAGISLKTAEEKHVIQFFKNYLSPLDEQLNEVSLVYYGTIINSGKQTLNNIQLHIPKASYISYKIDSKDCYENIDSQFTLKELLPDTTVDFYIWCKTYRTYPDFKDCTLKHENGVGVFSRMYYTPENFHEIYSFIFNSIFGWQWVILLILITLTIAVSFFALIIMLIFKAFS